MMFRCLRVYCSQQPAARAACGLPGPGLAGRHSQPWALVTQVGGRQRLAQQAGMYNSQQRFGF